MEKEYGRHLTDCLDAAQHIYLIRCTQEKTNGSGETISSVEECLSFDPRTVGTAFLFINQTFLEAHVLVMHVKEVELVGYTIKDIVVVVGPHVEREIHGIHGKELKYN